MNIETLSLYDFRGIHELELPFQGKSTILFGINGVGKSTVLSAINLLYASIINRIVKQRFKLAVNLERSDIKYGKASAAVRGEFRFGTEEGLFPYYRKITHDNRRVNGGNELETLVEHFENLYIGRIDVDEDNNLIQKNPDFNMPVFVNYGVNRLVLKTPLRIRKGEPFTQFSAFERAIENQIAFGKLFEWFLEQELYELQQQKINQNYKDKSLTAVKKAMLAMLDGYQDIHIEARPYSMKIVRGKEFLDILQLSDGEKCTLALFGDLARRLALANPSLDNPLEGQGVVLIDEVELHMHTLWQRRIIGELTKTFPNIQFIITTHSPQVLGEVGKEFNVFSLSRDQENIRCDGITALYGLDSNTVLEDALGTDSMNHVIKETVDRMYQCIEKKVYDEAETYADIIDEMTLNRNSDTVRGRILIERGRKLQNA